MKVTLHDRQLEVFSDDARFKVVAAGRRFGKTFLAAVQLLVEGSKTTKTRSDGVVIDLLNEEVFYVAPTFDQGKRIIWNLLLDLGEELISKKHEQTGVLTLINGRRISIKGSDRPDTLRGVGISYVVLDEYAFMKEEVWELIIRPALARAEGGALFIGTPDGKNHFYELWLDAHKNEGWRAFNYPSVDNPYLPAAEIKNAEDTMSRDRFRQEFLADFESSGGLVLNVHDFPLVEYIGGPGDTYIAIDLAGFSKSEGGKKLTQKDSHAIAVVHVHQGGWLIKNIIHGQWDTRECALRIMKAYRDYRPVKIGIERGIAQKAVMPYLEDLQNQYGMYFNVEELTHGNQNKANRIDWSLTGRSQKGKIQLLNVPGNDWVATFLQQCADFPNPLAHDDLIDALSYIDQIAEPYYDGPLEQVYWTPQDEITAY